MKLPHRLLGALVFVFALSNHVAMASFICAEPGGKRLIQVEGKELSEPGGKMLIYIDGNNLLLGDIHAVPFLVVDDNDVRPSAAGVVIAHFDGSEIRRGPNADGKVLMDYRYPNLSPSHSANRIYSVEGEQLNKQQLIAGLYLLNPELFGLSGAETAAQKKAMKEAGAEADRLAAADQVAGKWELLNGHGPVANVSSGAITVGPKIGAAYPVAFDHSKGGGPTWSGVGVYKEIFGDKLFWVAYGTPKTIGLCVYEIKAGGVLEGKWFPWYMDGDPKNTGTENLQGPDNLDGEYRILSAKAPSTGAPYAGTVTIKPLPIVGASEQSKPYEITWKLGTFVLRGIGIRTRDFLFVSSGAGADVAIARYDISNGAMTGNWYKLGSKEMGSTAASTP